MKEKILARTNTFLNQKQASKRRVRSIASSTAIETGESIQVLEKKITYLRHSKHRVALA